MKIVGNYNAQAILVGLFFVAIVMFCAVSRGDEYLYIPGHDAWYLSQVPSGHQVPSSSVLMLPRETGLQLFAHPSLGTPSHRIQLYTRINSVSNDSPYFVVISIQHGVGKSSPVLLYVRP